MMLSSEKNLLFFSFVFFIFHLINHMSKSQEFPHARQVQSVEKKTKHCEKENSKQREVCHSSQRISYVEVQYTNEKD